MIYIERILFLLCFRMTVHFFFLKSFSVSNNNILCVSAKYVIWKKTMQQKPLKYSRVWKDLYKTLGRSSNFTFRSDNCRWENRKESWFAENFNVGYKLLTVRCVLVVVRIRLAMEAMILSVNYSYFQYDVIYLFFFFCNFFWKIILFI